MKYGVCLETGVVYQIAFYLKRGTQSNCLVQMQDHDFIQIFATKIILVVQECYGLAYCLSRPQKKTKPIRNIVLLRSLTFLLVQFGSSFTVTLFSMNFVCALAVISCSDANPTPEWLPGVLQSAQTSQASLQKEACASSPCPMNVNSHQSVKAGLSSSSDCCGERWLSAILSATDANQGLQRTASGRLDTFL